MKLLHHKLPLELIQLYLGRQIRLDPDLYTSFLDKIMELQYQGKVCAVPTTILERHYNQSQEKIKKILELIHSD
jgi:hypothetical protein